MDFQYFSTKPCTLQFKFASVKELSFSTFLIIHIPLPWWCYKKFYNIQHCSIEKNNRIHMYEFSVPQNAKAYASVVLSILLINWAHFNKHHLPNAFR